MREWEREVTCDKVDNSMLFLPLILCNDILCCGTLLTILNINVPTQRERETCSYIIKFFIRIFTVVVCCCCWMRHTKEIDYVVISVEFYLLTLIKILCPSSGEMISFSGSGNSPANSYHEFKSKSLLLSFTSPSLSLVVEIHWDTFIGQFYKANNGKASLMIHRWNQMSIGKWNILLFHRSQWMSWSVLVSSVRAFLCKH